MKNIADFNDIADVSWRKASYSNSQGACVEVAVKDGSMVIQGQVFIRDSKNKKGPVLNFTEKEWNAFISGAKDGEFDLAKSS